MEWLKNSWLVAGFILVIAFVLGLILTPLFALIGSTSHSGPAVVSLIVSAMLAGQLYAKKYHAVMPRRLRVQVVLIYVVVQAILAFAVFSILGILVTFMLVVMPFILVAVGLLMYWMIGVGGKKYARATQRKQ